MKKASIILAIVSLIMTIKVNSFAQFPDPEILMYELQAEYEMKQAEKEAAEESIKEQEMYHRYNKITAFDTKCRMGFKPPMQELTDWARDVISLREEVIELCESKPFYKVSLWTMKLELDDMYHKIKEIEKKYSQIRATEIEIAKLKFDELVYTMNDFKKNRPPHEKIIQWRNDLATLRDDVLDLYESSISPDNDLQELKETLVSSCNELDLINTRTIYREDLIDKVNLEFKTMKGEAKRILSNQGQYSKRLPENFLKYYTIFIESMPELESLTKRELGLISDTSRYYTSCFQSLK